MNTLVELETWIASRPRVKSILSVCQKNEGSDAAHDLSHLFRVCLWTLRLGEGSVDPEEAAAAALLHDLVNLPKNHPERSKASSLSAEQAGPILKKAGFSPDACARIQEAIRDHSFSRGAVPASPLGKALQDADRLEALGAIGLMRVFYTGGKMGSALFDPEDPWAKERSLNDMHFSLDHFFTKLLKLPESFQTELGRREAILRAKRMERFLAETSEEIGVPQA